MARASFVRRTATGKARFDDEKTKTKEIEILFAEFGCRDSEPPAVVLPDARSVAIGCEGRVRPAGRAASAAIG